MLPTAATGRKLVISECASPKQHRSNTGNEPLWGNMLLLREGKRPLKKPLACNPAYRPMDVVTSKASDVSAQAVPDQVDVLELEERVLLHGKRGVIIFSPVFEGICRTMKSSSKKGLEGRGRQACFFLIPSRHTEGFGWHLSSAPIHSTQLPTPIMKLFL